MSSCLLDNDGIWILHVMNFKSEWVILTFKVGNLSFEVCFRREVKTMKSVLSLEKQIFSLKKRDNGATLKL